MASNSLGNSLGSITYLIWLEEALAKGEPDSER